MYDVWVNESSERKATKSEPAVKFTLSQQWDYRSNGFFG